MKHVLVYQKSPWKLDTSLTGLPAKSWAICVMRTTKASLASCCTFFAIPWRAKMSWTATGWKASFCPMSLISSTAFIKAEKRWCQWAIIFCHLAFQWSLTKHCSKALSQHSFFLFFSPLRSCKVCLLFFGEWLHLHLHVHFLFLELEVRLLKLTVLLSSFTVASFRLCPAYILTCGISLFGLINSLALLERYLTNCPTREDPVLCFCGRLALCIGCFTLSGTDGAY